MVEYDDEGTVWMDKDKGASLKVLVMSRTIGNQDYRKWANAIAGVVLKANEAERCIVADKMIRGN